MRIAFFGQSGPYSPHVLRALLQADWADAIKVIVEERCGPPGRSSHRWMRPVRKNFDGDLPLGHRLSTLGLAANVPILQTCDVNAAYVAQALEKNQIDMIVCAGFGCLFKLPLLQLATRGALNAHPSPLPRWRGYSPLFWALKAGEKRLAMTIHALDAKADHGPIYAQSDLEIPAKATGAQLFTLSGKLAGQMLANIVPEVGAGRLLGQPQDHSQATRAPKPQAADTYIEPSYWRCEHLVNFVCGAWYFSRPWVRIDDNVFILQQGISFCLGERMPEPYSLHGKTLRLNCNDGVAILRIGAHAVIEDEKLKWLT